MREERSKRKKAEAKARKLDQQLKYAQKNKFGDKRQNARKDDGKDDSVDREDEKDKFDGTEGTVSTKSVQENPKEENPVKVKKERDTSNISTVKLHGMSCWRYLGEFFKKIFNGCRDFFSLTPANIGMAYANC